MPTRTTTHEEDPPRDESGRFVAQDAESEHEPEAEIEAPTSEDTHAVHLLESQHRHVEELFERYGKAKGEEAQQQCFDEIADALAAHARIEEAIFYPECMTDATEDELREAVEEHLAIKRTIADLLELSPSDEQWEGKMTVLQELVEHHVKDEETKLMPLVEHFDDAQLFDMGARMRSMFEELMHRHPRTEVPAETGKAAPLH